MNTSETSVVDLLDFLESYIESTAERSDPDNLYNEGQYEAYSYIKEWVVANMT